MAPRDVLDGSNEEQGSPGDPANGDVAEVHGSRGEARLYLWKLAAQKRLIALIVIVTVGAAATYAFLAPPHYRSSATVLIWPVGVNLAALSPKDTSKLVNIDTEIQLVISSNVAASAAARVDGGMPASALVAYMNVTPVKNSLAIEISYEGPSPTQAQDAATAFANAYLANRGAGASALVGAQLAKLHSNIATTATEIKRLDAIIVSSRGGSPEAIAARSALRGQEHRLTALQTQADAVQFDNVRPGSVIHPAQLPTRPFSPDRPLDVGLGTLFGLFLAIGVALIRDRFDLRVRDRSVLEAALGAPLLTIVPPADKDKESKGVMAFTDPNAAGTEAFRALRASVLSALPDGGTILVASSLPDEGKTTVASNLSVVLAQAGKAVVLISADVRKPTLHLLFDAPNTWGLSSILMRDRSPIECLARTPSPNLVVCPAGPLPANPAEMLQSQGMRELVEILRQTADFVVLDCPPVLAVSDALGLVPIANAVIFVVDAETTKRMAVTEGSHRLRQVGAYILGGVLNKMPLIAGGYGYGYGYGYGPAPSDGSAAGRG